MTDTADVRAGDTELFLRYQELQRYVGWTSADAARIRAVAPSVTSNLPSVIDDFYAEILRHPSAGRVITGGESQIVRLKQSLIAWLQQLLAGEYSEEYVAARWQVGLRHVEIGLDQVYTNVALSRVRRLLSQIINETLMHDVPRLLETQASLNMLIDLDLAIIEDAYQSEHLARQRRMERLAAIGQVAGGVAHELRNPLNVMKTSVYYLVHARELQPEKIREHLGRIERQVGIADSVIGALSDFARLPNPDRQSVDVYTAFGEAKAATELPSNIECSIHVATGLPPARVDSQQLQIVLGNLIRNARDAMPDGGQLELRATSAGSKLQIEVQDTGTGIPPENLRQIMEPFFSTKARGIGLGLALSRAILERNGGSLQVVSQQGIGSTFTVRLEAATHCSQE